MSAEDFLENNKAKDGAAFAMQAAESQAREAASRGFVGEFIESAKYSAIQAPIHGLTQIADRVLLTDFTAKTTFMAQPKPATDLADWHGQQLGGAAGAIPWFVGINMGVNRGMNKLVGKVAVGETMSVARAVTTTAVTAGLYEGLLMPSAPPKESQENLTLAERLLSLGGDRALNATKGALTFATLTLAARGLHDSGLLRNKLALGVVSGIPAGVVSVQADSLLHGKGPASISDSAKGAYTFAMIGGGFSAAHQIPLGEWSTSSKVTEAAKQAADASAGRGGKPGSTSSVEFRLADAASALRLRAFQRGETPTAWAEIHSAGEPKRTLFVQHNEGNAVPDGKAAGQPGDGKAAGQLGDGLPFDGSRADLIAMCYMPESMARHLGLPDATNRPLFLDMPGKEVVRLSPERLSPEAIELGGKDARGSRISSRRIKALTGGEVDPESLPAMGDWRPDGRVRSGANSTVIFLHDRPGLPEMVLKITRGDFSHKQFNADIYDSEGRVISEPHQTTDSAGTDLHIYFESKVDFDPVDWTGHNEFMQGLEAQGIVLEPGSGPPVGKCVNSGKWVVADRDAASKFGSGEHQSENAGKSGEELDSIREKEDEAPENPWDDGFDGSDGLGAREAIDAIKLTAEEQAVAIEAFCQGTPLPELQALLGQMTDGMSSKSDVKVLLTLENGGSVTQTDAQMKLAAQIAVSRGLSYLNPWVKQLAANGADRAVARAQQQNKPLIKKFTDGRASDAASSDQRVRKPFDLGEE